MECVGITRFINGRKMTSLKHPIGLFGGTFDPIHKGHIKIAEQLMAALELQGMQFIPNKEPMHRDQPAASAEHRLAMVRIATAKNPKFIVNDVEIKRPGPTYTIDTISRIREQIPEQPLCLILGTDVFAKMNTWHEFERIIELVHIVVINRPGVSLSYEPWMKTLIQEHQTSNLQNLCQKPGGYLLQHEIEPLMISATEIRKKIKAKKVINDEVCPEVLRYIQQHRLYS